MSSHCFCLIAGLFNHQQSISKTPAVSLPSMRNNAAGDIASGRAFDNGCICHFENYSNTSMVDSLLRGNNQTCHCCAPQLQPEMDFVNALMNIGVKLGALDTKEKRSMYH